MHSDSYPATPPLHLSSVAIFNWWARLSWLLLFTLLMLAELLPRPNFAPLLFYSYSGCKALMFVLLGFLTPLAFWRFDRVGLGVIASAVGAGAAEMSQSLVEGHRSSWLEFLLKMLLLLAGFAVALSVRYDRKISVGRFGIRFTGSHLTSTD
jgi:hypothetical protein